MNRKRGAVAAGAVGALAVMLLPFAHVTIPGLFEGPLDSPGTLNLLGLCFVFGALALARYGRAVRDAPNIQSSDLASRGVYPRPCLHGTPGALTSRFHPCRDEPAVCFCGTFLRVTPTGRYPARCPLKPGLSSRRVARLPGGLCGASVTWDWGRCLDRRSGRGRARFRRRERCAASLLPRRRSRRVRRRVRPRRGSGKFRARG